MTEEIVSVTPLNTMDGHLWLARMDEAEALGLEGEAMTAYVWQGVED